MDKDRSRNGTSSPSPTSATIPQKRPYEESTSSVPAASSSTPAAVQTQALDSSRQHLVKTKPPREKKESWKKKEANLAAAGTHPSTTTTSAPTTGGGGGATTAGNGATGSGTVGTGGDGLPSSSSMAPKASTATAGVDKGKPPGLQRWRLPPPQESDYNAAKPPTFTSSTVSGSETGKEFFSLSEHPKNRRGFRYTPCEATRLLPLVSYRCTEVPPFAPRIAFEDMAAQLHIDRSGTIVTTEKGFRMARANVGVREGNWYYEVRILRGIGSVAGEGGTGGDPHVRVGWARREAPLDAPVGFDAYSYGIRDQEGQKVHMSRPKDFAGESFVTGDVIGLQIYIPPLKTQRTLLLGNLTGITTTSSATSTSQTTSKDTPATTTFSSNPNPNTNPATSTTTPAPAITPAAPATHTLTTADTIRDRIPIRYKNQLYFEQFEYTTSKEMEDLTAAGGVPSTSTTANTTSRMPPTLPTSFIRIYKNGRLIGTPYKDLFAFLPPASRPNPTIGGRELDDGLLGYFPAVSVFRGGVAEWNFGPDWLFPPEGTEGTTNAASDPPPNGANPSAPDEDTIMQNSNINPPGNQGKDNDIPDLPTLRPLSDRYNEQIAEDITYDLVDEVDLFFTTTTATTTSTATTGITAATSTSNTVASADATSKSTSATATSSNTLSGAGGGKGGSATRLGVGANSNGSRANSVAGDVTPGDGGEIKEMVMEEE